MAPENINESSDQPKRKTLMHRLGLSTGFVLLLGLVWTFTYWPYIINFMYTPLYLKEYTFENQQSSITIPANALERKSRFVLKYLDIHSQTRWSPVATSATLIITSENSDTSETTEVLYTPTAPDQTYLYDYFRWNQVVGSEAGILTIKEDQNLTFPLTLEHWILPLTLESEVLL